MRSRSLIANLCAASMLITTGLTAQSLDAWRARRFGMFIHWGPVSLRGTEIGWSRGREIPVDEYDHLYEKFTAKKFDAKRWVQVAKDAGMRYVVITAKHHDGFCLWPSEQTDYDIGATPFGRDVLKELSAACREQGLAFGTYYSVCDWHHPDFPFGSPGGRTKKSHPDLPRYLEYLRSQVTELIENYGPLSTMWFDVPQGVGPALGKAYVDLVRKLQPGIVINSRAYRDKGKPVGDYDTPEQRIGSFDRSRPWETCMTICRQWAWKPKDRMKSLKQCVHTLIRTVGGDGNLLLNVGPMPDGRIEPRQARRLKEIGAWLGKYGSGVFDTRGGPFKPAAWGVSTCKRSSVWVFVLEWPAEGALHLPPLGRKILGAELVGGPAVDIEQSKDGVSVRVPLSDRGKIATVIRLRVAGDALSIMPVDSAR